MKRLINKLLCMHKWEILKEIRHYGSDAKLPWGITFILVCKKCGKIKKTTSI